MKACIHAYIHLRVYIYIDTYLDMDLRVCFLHARAYDKVKVQV